ncbi:MAG TPA: class I SAM-dependent methyltransferase [Pyrinomonadaceae bacterium]
MGVSAETHPRLLISPRFSVASAPGTQTVKPSQLPFISEVKAKLQNGQYRLASSACPCGASEGPVVSEVDRYGLPLNFVLCASCGTIRIDPYLDDSSLADFYTRFFQQMYGRVPNVESYFAQQAKYGERILAAVKSWLKPGSSVYEVGCGAGGALNVFRRNSYLIAGSDYSAELVGAGKERGVENLYYGSLTDIPAQLHDGKADLIYLNHVFEHMNHPLGFLEDCRSRLASGGRIVIIVPDVSRIDRFTCPAGDLLQFLHIAHKYNFSFEGIRRLSARAGYRVRRISPDAKIQTPHSIMPELWIELTSDSEARGSVSVKTERSNDGTKMLHYLQKTEKLYARGMCRAQLVQKLRSNRSSLENNLARLRRATPAKVLRKLKGIT